MRPFKHPQFSVLAVTLILSPSSVPEIPLEDVQCYIRRQGMKTMCALIKVRAPNSEGEHIQPNPTPYLAIISFREIQHFKYTSSNVALYHRVVERYVSHHFE